MLLSDGTFAYSSSAIHRGHTEDYNEAKEKQEAFQGTRRGQSLSTDIAHRAPPNRRRDTLIWCPGEDK